MTSVLRNIPNTVRTVALSAVDALMPQTCFACGCALRAGLGSTCPACRAAIQDLAQVSYCPTCGRSAQPISIHDDRCRGCRTERHWNILGIARVGPYSGPLRALALGLKYGGSERNADYLASLLASAICAQSWSHELDALVPVPMHWLRRLQRPCAHATLLAEFTARRLRKPLWRAVQRHRYTPSQMELKVRTQRFANVIDCFGLRRRSWFNGRLAGATVCIIDNVLTTGATIHETSKVLRKAGAKRIYAAVVSRAVAVGDQQASTDALIPADTA